MTITPLAVNQRLGGSQGEPGEDSKVEGPSGAQGDRVSPRRRRRRRRRLHLSLVMPAVSPPPPRVSDIWFCLTRVPPEPGAPEESREIRDMLVRWGWTEAEGKLELQGFLDHRGPADKEA
ncbi:hypothetical protein CRUP_024192 [Coryphaenoides rupestris]|nr:hypothetical protein CRUP_024192 [Coryphaenoides rupestris]